MLPRIRELKRLAAVQMTKRDWTAFCHLRRFQRTQKWFEIDYRLVRSEAARRGLFSK